MNGCCLGSSEETALRFECCLVPIGGTCLGVVIAKDLPGGKSLRKGMMRLASMPGTRGVILAVSSPALRPDMFGWCLMKILVYDPILLPGFGGSAVFFQNISSSPRPSFLFHP
jgi:hypothetical protein